MAQALADGDVVVANLHVGVVAPGGWRSDPWIQRLDGQVRRMGPRGGRSVVAGGLGLAGWVVGASTSTSLAPFFPYHPLLPCRSPRLAYCWLAPTGFSIDSPLRHASSGFSLGWLVFSSTWLFMTRHYDWSGHRHVAALAARTLVVCVVVSCVGRDACIRHWRLPSWLSSSRRLVVVREWEVMAKAWTTASADVASSLEASFLYLFPCLFLDL